MRPVFRPLAKASDDGDLLSERGRGNLVLVRTGRAGRQAGCAANTAPPLTKTAMTAAIRTASRPAL